MVEFLEAYNPKELRLNVPLVVENVRLGKFLLGSFSWEVPLEKNCQESGSKSQLGERKKFSTVPPLYQVAYLRQDVQEVFDKFNHAGFEYNEYLSLVLFVIHGEFNCRIAALLYLEYAAYAVIFPAISTSDQEIC